MGLRAVVFDYGMVLTGPPDPTAYADLLRITGLTASVSKNSTGSIAMPTTKASSPALAFWQKIVDDAGLEPGRSLRSKS